ncbi:MAG: glycosyltransferase family A protein [Methanomassiliicoccales archaeon]|jgi:hypothetical protein
MKVSCVCCTYGRFAILGRSLACWLYQDFPDSELIIYNTSPIPLQLHNKLRGFPIKVFNRSVNANGLPYSSLGEIRREALQQATGNIYVCWDDDDLFLPWHISQGMQHILKENKVAWMPEQSYFSYDGGKIYKHATNSMEASVLVSIREVLKYGFSNESGSEHLPWRRGLVDAEKLDEHCSVTPFESYAYIWGEPLAPHKTSGDLRNPLNFENHKKYSDDFGEGKLLVPWAKERIDQYFINIQASFPSIKLQERFDYYLKKHCPPILMQDWNN